MRPAGPAALALAALLAALAPAAGCTRSAPPGRPAGREILTVAVRADVTGVFPNPPTSNEAFTIDLFSNVLEGLFRIDSALAVKPALVTSWSNADGKTWTFRLREGVRFSDGTPLSAEDVTASLRAAIETPFPTGAFLAAIRSVETVSPVEVRVTTREECPSLPSYLTAGFVLSRAALAGTPIPPLGTGPYAFAGREPGRSLTLLRNPYHEPRAAFDEIRLRVVPDGKARVAALLAGEADIAEAVPLDAVDALSRDARFRVLARPGIRVLYLAPRVDRPPFDDARVREALDLAIDRDELNARVYGGRGVPASQPVPVTVVGYEESLPVTRADRERARRLLDSAAGGSPVRVVLDAPSDRYLEDAALAREAARQMELAGFRVTVRTRPKAEYFPFLETGAAQLYLFSWACDTLEANDALDGAFRSPVSGRPPNQNHQGLADRELDRLVDGAARASEIAERIRLLRAAMSRLREIRAAAFLVVMPETIAFSRRISWTPPPTLVLRLHEVAPAPR
ncbi:MAG: ABC transporter substrate-binding protein [Thermoanaerobaculia bacterium]